jgi:hypothetical protein
MCLVQMALAAQVGTPAGDAADEEQAPMLAALRQLAAAEHREGAPPAAQLPVEAALLGKAVAPQPEAMQADEPQMSAPAMAAVAVETEMAVSAAPVAAVPVEAAAVL